MNHAPHIYEQLEAFRPGIDDLDEDMWSDLRAALQQDHSLQERMGRIQASDRSIRSALHEVAVPGDLSQRLLERISTQTASLEAISSQPATGNEPVTLPARGQEHAHWPFARRRFAFAGGAVALVGLLAIAAGLWPPDAPKDQLASREELNAYVENWHRAPELLSAEGWSKSFGNVEKTHPPDSAITVRPAQWRRLSANAAPAAVVYQLSAKGATAHLFVVRTQRRFSVPALPMIKWSLTGSHRAGAWQRGDLLYVLVVDEGDRAVLEDFVREPRLT